MPKIRRIMTRAEAYRQSFSLYRDLSLSQTISDCNRRKWQRYAKSPRLYIFGCMRSMDVDVDSEGVMLFGDSFMKMKVSCCRLKIIINGFFCDIFVNLDIYLPYGFMLYVKFNYYVPRQSQLMFVTTAHPNIFVTAIYHLGYSSIFDRWGGQWTLG